MVKYLKISLSDAHYLIPIHDIVTTAADAAKTKEQLNSIVDAIEEALSTSWTKPFYVLEPKYPVTGIAQLQEAWA